MEREIVIRIIYLKKKPVGWEWFTARQNLADHYELEASQVKKEKKKYIYFF